MADYYDHVLGLIPIGLFGITALLTVAGVSPHAAVSAAGVPVAGVIAHALFVNGPGTPEPEPEPEPLPDAAPAAGPAAAD